MSVHSGKYYMRGNRCLALHISGPTLRRMLQMYRELTGTLEGAFSVLAEARRTMFARMRRGDMCHARIRGKQVDAATKQLASITISHLVTSCHG